MHLSSQALVLAFLALEVALAQPAHRHQHKHRRSLADVFKVKRDQQFGTPAGGWHSVDGDFTTQQWSCIAACGSPTCGDCASASNGPTPSSPASSSSPSSSSSGSPSQPSSSSSSAPSTGSGGGTGDVSDLMDVWTTQDPTSATGQTAADVSETCRWGNTGNTKAKRATVAEDTALDSNGAAPSGCPAWYPYNIHPLKDCKDLSSYANSAKLTNTGSKGQFSVYDKSYRGPDGCGGPGTDCGGEKKAFFTFTLNEGQSACFGLDDNAFMDFVPVSAGRDSTSGMWNSNIGEITTGGSGFGSYDVSLMNCLSKAQGGLGSPAIPMSVQQSGFSVSSAKPGSEGGCNFDQQGQQSVSGTYPGCKVDVPSRLDLQVCFGTNSGC